MWLQTMQYYLKKKKIGLDPIKNKGFNEALNFNVDFFFFFLP